jgi:hypothetical protein
MLDRAKPHGDRVRYTERTQCAPTITPVIVASRHSVGMSDMNQLARNRIVLLVILPVLAALATLALPAAAQEAPPPTTTVTVTADGQLVITATKSAAVTDLPVTGHGNDAASGSEALALRHTLLTVVVLLAAAAMALGGIGILWCYERR